MSEEKMVQKLEHPERIAELLPKETLLRMGLQKDSVFCDIGAGTGIFTFAAAEMTAKSIYAVEISQPMRAWLQSKNNTPNVTIAHSIQEVPEGDCDTALLCTVLHEIDDIPGMLSEIRRILKREGTLAVIEFHKAETPMGPPVSHRIAEQDAVKILTENGFLPIEGFRLGENFYCLMFQNACGG